MIAGGGVSLCGPYCTPEITSETTADFGSMLLWILGGIFRWMFICSLVGPKGLSLLDIHQNCQLYFPTDCRFCAFLVCNILPRSMASRFPR